MELFEKVLTVGVGITILVFFMPMALGLISLYINEFVNRGRTKYQLGARWCYLWHCAGVRTCKKRTWSKYITEDCGDYVFGSWMMSLFFCAGVTVVAGAGFYYLSLEGLLILLCVLFALVLPRYLGDLAHALKWCFKSKDSERLKAIEKELEELKGGR